MYSRFILLFVALGLCALSSFAQPRFPSKAVRIIVPSSAGSGPDQIARVVGQALSELWGQPVIIENRAGASGILGFDQVAKADGDGHTLLVAAHNFVIVPALGKTPFDVQRDFVPVGRIATGGMVLVVHPAMKVNTLQEFVAAAKASPGRFSYGSAGPGTTHHVMMELLKHVAKLHIVHIPYRGPSPILPDLLENRVNAAFITSPAALVHVPSGRVKALAVAGERRLLQFPNVPTVAESGYKAFDPVLWYGMFAPGSATPELTAQLNRDLLAVLATPKVVESLRNFGIDSAPMDSVGFKNFVVADLLRYQKLVRDTGITSE